MYRNESSQYDNCLRRWYEGYDDPQINKIIEITEKIVRNFISWCESCEKIEIAGIAINKFNMEVMMSVNDVDWFLPLDDWLVHIGNCCVKNVVFEEDKRVIMNVLIDDFREVNFVILNKDIAKAVESLHMSDIEHICNSGHHLLIVPRQNMLHLFDEHLKTNKQIAEDEFVAQVKCFIDFSRFVLDMNDSGNTGGAKICIYSVLKWKIITMGMYNAYAFDGLNYIEEHKNCFVEEWGSPSISGRFPYLMNMSSELDIRTENEKHLDWLIYLYRELALEVSEKFNFPFSSDAFEPILLDLDIALTAHMPKYTTLANAIAAYKRMKEQEEV